MITYHRYSYITEEDPPTVQPIGPVLKLPFKDLIDFLQRYEATILPVNVVFPLGGSAFVDIVTESGSNARMVLNHRLSGELLEYKFPSSTAIFSAGVASAAVEVTD